MRGDCFGFVFGWLFSFGFDCGLFDCGCLFWLFGSCVGCFSCVRCAWLLGVVYLLVIMLV